MSCFSFRQLSFHYERLHENWYRLSGDSVHRCCSVSGVVCIRWICDSRELISAFLLAYDTDMRVYGLSDDVVTAGLTELALWFCSNQRRLDWTMWQDVIVWAIAIITAATIVYLNVVGQSVSWLGV